MRMKTLHSLCLLLALGLAACAANEPPADLPFGTSFSIAVIPDTQNYVDYRHQRTEGFALDGKELFIAQMQDIARRDEVVFVAAVGDVWQHSSVNVDPEHEARGKGEIDNPILVNKPTPKTWDIEIPGAIEGYRVLAASGKPFGVAPGNHDYDAFWSIRGFPPRTGKQPFDRLNGEDLRTLTPEKHAQFQAIVRGGLHWEKGMVGFSDRLGESDVEAIRAYLVDRAHYTLASEAGDAAE